MRAVLCSAEILARLGDLDCYLRARLLCAIPPFSPASPRATHEAFVTAFELCGLSPDQAPDPSPPVVSRAVEAAERWMEEGVFVIRGAELPPFHIAEGENLPLLFASGNRSVIQKPKVALLNSRTSSVVSPDDLWIRISKSLVRSFSGVEFALVTSYGAIHYEIAACLARDAGLELLVVCPEQAPFMESARKASTFRARYQDLFDSESSLLVSPFPPGPCPSRSCRLVQRDKLVANSASIVMLGAIRDQGVMTGLALEAVQRGATLRVFAPESYDSSTAGAKRLLEACGSGQKTIYEEKGLGKVVEIQGRSWLPQDRTSPGRPVFSAGPKPYTGESNRAEKRAEPVAPTEDCELEPWPQPGATLIHYTRACPGPWPGQTAAQYCRSLINAEPDSKHTAFDTLCRMLQERLIRSSKRLVRGDIPCVSFTGCELSRLSALIEWRPGLIRWSVEPYGIAISRKAMIGIGAEAVVYGDEETFQSLEPNRKFLFQWAGQGGRDWRIEQEWRISGDLTLAGLRPEEILVIVRRVEEARIIKNRFGYRVTLSGIAEGKT